jgi:hypothetical protein
MEPCHRRGPARRMEATPCWRRELDHAYMVEPCGELMSGMGESIKRRPAVPDAQPAMPTIHERFTGSVRAPFPSMRSVAVSQAAHVATGPALPAVRATRSSDSRRTASMSCPTKR